MTLGFIITMYKEHTTVLSSIKEALNKFPESKIIVVHSDDQNETSELAEIKKLASEYILLPNLGVGISVDAFRMRIGSRSLARNYSKGFSILYEMHEVSHIVGLTGDTLIVDAGNILRRISEMESQGHIAMVSRALGSAFHEASDEPEKGIAGNRVQRESSTDFMPQYFILDGRFAYATKALSQIEVTNELTFEQCIGDALLGAIEIAKEQRLDNPTVGLLSKIAYGYNDGVVQQYT
jgi:hypothetical protein